MSFLVTRSVPLGETTMAALREAGAVFPRRDRDDAYVDTMLSSHEFLWNMGKSDLMVGGDAVFNMGEEVVQKLLDPATTWERFGDLMPPQTGTTEFVWEKSYGRAGRGKVRHRTADLIHLTLPYWEDHINGEEYRVLTVGNKRVQQFRRFGDNESRTYRWLPMRELPQPIKGVIHDACHRLPTQSIIAWDAILDLDNPNTAYILEGNTSPGLNDRTVYRIVDQVRKDLHNA